ncbi:MAG: LysM peptidoglycan-binding domain-containing protein [Chloroflexi bacterium]|nr:LysM peptidoglycan-binding domain-containing protein [Chloroflexota bacterium]
MEAWSVNTAYGASAGQQGMGMRVGIDPTGGTNAFSPNVVWSRVNDSYDTWELYSVEAVARNSAVTVFTRSTPIYPLEHNDLYVDDASLVVVGGGGAVTTTASGGAAAPQAIVAPTSTNIVAPEPMPTPAADGKSYYLVRSGDTLTHIAYRFGTTVLKIKQLNGWRGTVIIYVRQKIIVGP